MQCPQLTGTRLKFCSAVEVEVAVSNNELSIFCNSGQYEKCQVYMAMMRNKERVDFKSYCLIFLDAFEKNQAA